MPDRGFFAQADTKATVYSPLGGVDQGSIYKRGGRFSPEFLWNTNWQDQLALEEDVERQRLEAEGQDLEQAAGHLSFRRIVDLNSLDVDLSEQLRPRQRAEPAAADAAAAAPAQAPWQGRKQQQEAAAAAAARRPAEGAYPRMPPRRAEAQRWERTNRSFTRRAVAKPTSEEEKTALVAQVLAERAAYARYKQQLVASTAALGAGLTALTFGLYSKDVGASFAVGAVGSVAYLHLLNKSIDGLGGTSELVPEVGSAAELSTGFQPPRLLIPLIMAMTYNRWNTLAADSLGVHLQLMPMLLGFLTYKGAVIARGALDLFADLSGSSGSQAAQAEAAAAAQSTAGNAEGQLQPGQERQGQADDLLVGRDYASRVLQG